MVVVEINYMEAKEIAKIKEYQREFKQLFNKTLEIDWELMNNIQTKFSIKKLLEKSFKKHNANIEILYKRKRINKGWTNEKLALRDFSKTIIKNKLNIEEAARVIKRDRSIIYYYAGKR